MTTREVFEDLLKEMKLTATQQQLNYYNGIKSDIEKALASGINTQRLLDNDGPFPHRKRKWGYAMPAETKIQYMFLVKAKESTYYSEDAEYILRADIDDYIDKRVAQDIYDMFESFLIKQTRKTDDIIKGRPIIVNGYVSSGSLECKLNFAFADGSQFDMQCQIVWKVSPLGNPFWQFPTTFHNAIRADGSKVSPASEANMKASFFRDIAA